MPFEEYRSRLAMIPAVRSLDALVVIFCRTDDAVKPDLELLYPGKPLRLRLGDRFIQIVERTLGALQANREAQLLLLVEENQEAAKLCLGILLSSSGLRQQLGYPERLLVAAVDAAAITLFPGESERLYHEVCAEREAQRVRSWTRG